MSAATIRTTNPATGETLAEYEVLDERGIDDALARSHAAWQSWRVSPVEERTALLGRLADLFETQGDTLAREATLEMGKTFASAKAEVGKCAALFRHLSQEGPAMLAPERWELGNGRRAEGHWLPLGPVLAIMPWNFPYWQVVRFLAPAILAGNTALLKHASSVQGVAAALARAVREAGAPEGLFENLPVRAGAVAGIIADDRVAAATLTGSEGAGQAVAEAAGRALKKVVLELGGSDPFIVMPSADLDEAVAAAVTARIQNTGQSCICGKRMIVHADVFDPFTERFVAAMAAVKAGDPFDAATDMGPLSSAEQRDTVLDQVAAARREGARFLLEPNAPEGPGAYLTAGVMTDVAPGSETARDEIFGPVAQLYRVADMDEAIRLANAIPFGLGSSVWTKDENERDRFVRDIEAGMTAVNQVLSSDVRAPFGGIKKSGYGRELSRYGLHEFMNLKTVMLPA